MVKVKTITLVISAIMLNGCVTLDSLKFWESWGSDEPTIEEQMDEQYKRTQGFTGYNEEDQMPQASSQQLSEMYEEWEGMKPQLRELIQLSSDLQAMAELSDMTAGNMPTANTNNSSTQSLESTAMNYFNSNSKPTNMNDSNMMSSDKAESPEQMRREQALLGVEVAAPEPKPKMVEKAENSFKYSVQIAATGTEESAQQVWNSQLQKFTAFLSSYQPSINKTMSNNKAFYRVKFGGFDTMRQAQSACNSFKAIGGQCIIRENKLSTSFGVR